LYPSCLKFINRVLKKTMFTRNGALVLLLVAVLFRLGSCERLRDRSYYKLPQAAFSACVRRFNGTHQAGCSSSLGGNVGRLIFADTAAELDGLSRDDTADAVLAVPAELFALQAAKLHGLPGGLQGLLVLYSESERDFTFDFAAKTGVNISEDSACPNDRLSAYRGSRGGSCSGPQASPAWNAAGTSAALLDWSFPVALVTKSEQIFTLKNCTQRESSLRHCAIELRTPMHGAASSVTCLRRPQYTSLISALTSISQLMHFCGPMGDLSLVWTASSTAMPTNTVRAPASVMLILARLDSFSMFASNSPASGTLTPAIAVLLAVANALASSSNGTTGRDVAIVFVNGDSWDYIGSQRLVHDLHGNQLLGESGQPARINASHVHSIIELGELSNLESMDQLAAYTDPSVYRVVNSTVDSHVKSLGLKSDALISDRKLPPASTQTFLRPPGSKESAPLQPVPALLLTDHKRDQGFRNRNYNSFADLRPTPSGVVQTLATLADRIATLASQFLTNSSAAKVDDNLLKAYVDCLQGDATCQHAISGANVTKSWLDKVYAATNSINGLIGAYVYEYQSRFLPNQGGNHLRYLTYLLLSNATGDIVPGVTKRSDCLALNTANDTVSAGLPVFYDLTSVSGASNNVSGVCLRLSLTALPAVSPIDSSDYNAWSGSGDFSTWTESQWETPTVRLFMRPTRSWGAAHLLFGVAVLLLSLQFVLGAKHGLEANFPVSVAP
ncbi:hypothetical protein BOX15_Mlig005963g3, partial [Macrostomum lignano]